MFPVSKGQLVNVVAFFSEPSKEGTIFEGPWTSKASKDELIAKYNGWEEEVQILLQVRSSSRTAAPFPRYLSIE